MNNAPSFSILPATSTDITRLAEIHVIALANDPTACLKFSSEAEFRSKIVGMLESQLPDPTWHVMKAIDTASGTITAWASWKMHEGAPHPDRAVNGIPFNPESLGHRIRQVSTRVLESWSTQNGHCDYLTLRACFTDPVFQRKGAGLALVRYGAEMADRTGLPTFVQATPMGKGVYEKAGFVVFDKLDVDLKNFGVEGVYRFWYLSRGGGGAAVENVN